MAKILIIEDDITLREQLKEVLASYQYEVFAIENFLNVEEQFIKIAPDLVLLDINLPRFDGNYYCRIFRRSSKVPIIITSARNSELDQILSMELGADDYVTKPFPIPVLLAKINALMRRMYGEYAIEETTKDIMVKGIILDEYNFKIRYGELQEELSKNEFKLMKKFLLKPDQIITREELLEEIWDMSNFVDDNTLTVNVARMKSKLTALGLNDMIKTKRGLGYFFDSSEIM